MKILEVNKDNLYKLIKEDKNAILIEFYASWCKPCQMMSEVINMVIEEVEEVKIAKVDIDQEAELAEEYKIEVVPTIVKMIDGKEVRRSEGLLSKNELLHFLKY